MIKRTAIRAIRKSAHLTRRALSVGANYSGKVENKAHRIINGMDDTIKLHDKVLFEKLYYESLPYITPIHPALPTAGRDGKISLLIPSLQSSSFFGGTATALIFAALMAEAKGYNLRVIETLKKGNVKPTGLKEFFDKSGITFSQEVELADLSPRKYNVYGYIDLHPDDVFICSAWWDAHALEELPLTNKFIYLIQDFEPIFYNNSDLQVLSERTYHSEKFLPVCNTELMLQYMKDNGYDYIAKEGIFFEPAVNIGKKIGLANKKAGKKKLFIYGRPSVERNLFFTAIKAVDEAFSERILDPAEWECYMAGQSGISNILLKTGKEVTALGKMSTDDYYAFAKDVDLAVSLMLAPHPSYPPLELSSLGAAVVTTAYGAKTDLSRYNDNLLVCEPTVADVKHGIEQAVQLSRDTRRKNAAKTSLNDDWQATLQPIIDQLASRF